jgi:hypothetical protein
MPLFIVFILGAVVLGAGSMLSPAWHTKQPRIALSATLCLALVVGGAVFYAEAFGWDILVVDYLLFALMSFVVLGGTLSNAQVRAEAQGETLRDGEQGWPGPQDLAFFAVIAMLLLIPLLSLPVSLGTHGQQLGFQTLIIRFGESFTSLAPFHPETTVIISPGFHAISAYLGQQLGQPIPIIQMSITAVVVFLCVWLAYDLGAELRDKRLGRAMAISMMLCGGVFISYLDGHYTELVGLLFLMAFLMYALRFIRQFNLADMIAGGLMMGAVVYTNLTMSIILMLGFIPLCVMVWFTYRPERPSADLRKSQLGLTFGFPLVMLIGIAPWLLKNLSLIFPPVPSPFPSDVNLWNVMIIGQGIIIIPLAVWGAIVGLRSTDNNDTRFITITMLIWLALVADFALLGVIWQVLPFIGDWVNAPNLARHGVILPLVWLGGLAILQLWETRLSQHLQSQLRSNAYLFIAGVGAMVLMVGLAFNPILDSVRPLLNLPSATATSDDIAVMMWLKNNTPEDTMLYALDDDGWLPVFAERNALNFRAVHYFEWNDVITPADTLGIDLSNLSDAEFDYVFVSSVEAQDLSAVDGLQLVFEQGDAQAYQVVTNTH